MPTIVRIGYSYYLVKSEASAIKALTAMAGCLEIRPTHKAGEEQYEVYRRQVEIGMIQVCPAQLKAEHLKEDDESEPIITPPPRKPRQLTMGPEGTTT
jgi:hypothetical protein